MGGTRSLLHYFTKTEAALWSFSVLFISLAFAGFDGRNYISLWASLLGVTSLIFCAKGNPVGQLLMVLFSLLYGYISYGFTYYGEMLTYLGMTAPMALVALVSWLKNPYKGKRSEVKVERLRKRDAALMLLLALPVTAAFYQLHRRVPHLPAQLLLCPGLRPQRPGAHRAVGPGHPEGQLLCLGAGLLYSLLPQRPLRFLQLAEDAAPPGSRLTGPKYIGDKQASPGGLQNPPGDVSIL